MATAEDVLDFARTHHRAILTTLRRDGLPQSSPIAVATVGEQIVVSTRETAMKTKNIERNPWASVCIVADEWFGPWYQLEGPVEVVRGDAALDPLVEYYRAVAGEHPDWDEYRAAMVRERRVLLRITPERVGPNVSG